MYISCKTKNVDEIICYKNVKYVLTYHFMVLYNAGTLSVEGEYVMQLQNGTKSAPGLMGRLICRYIGNMALFLAGVCVILGISAFISDLEEGNHGRVYAVDSSANDFSGEQQFQFGLMGVVSGVADMQRYSDEARVVSVVNGNENALAGASGVDRRAIRRYSIQSGTQVASQLGYFAQQAVYENQMSSADYQALLQIVEAEATGGDLMSKMMVAGVVLNRVQDEHFPDAICDVVWEDSQFQPTMDGRIYSVTVTQETEEAVERVLAGEDYTQGALFFFSRDTSEEANIRWFDSSLVKIFEYGGHEYFTFQDYVV
jgi:N-acetylmuramoyl-L-alanine amidase